MSGQLEGIFPIVPTIFDDQGEFDEPGQRATVDFLLHSGVHGLVVLANASEGYAVTDAERPHVIASVVSQVAGRVPVVGTCNHPSTFGAVQFARQAQDLGCAAVMFMPPFFGQWLSDVDGVRRHGEALARATAVPLILQDHPLSGVGMPAPFLVDLARTVDRLACFKVEAMRAPAKIGQMRGLAGGTALTIFGGMGGLVFLEELEQGASGTMPSSLLPEAFVRVFAQYREGHVRQAADLLAHYLPLIAFEMNLGGQRVVKELLMLRGTIRSSFVRGPIRSGWDDQTACSFRRLIDSMDLVSARRP